MHVDQAGSIEGSAINQRMKSEVRVEMYEKLLQRRRRNVKMSCV
jgi:hypothetical protein